MAKRSEMLKWSVAATAAGAAVAILFFYPPTEHPFYPRCPLYVWTGLYCPGCGSLRAVHSLLHGDFLSALRFNSLLILSSPLLAWLFLNSVRTPSGKPLLKVGPRAGLIWSFVGATLAFGILRNLPFAAFSFLAP